MSHRSRGLVMLLACVVGGAAWGGVLALLRQQDIVTSPRVFKMLGLPLGAAVVGALIGLAKLVLGRPLRAIDEAWADLAGWQRGVIGLLVVTIAIAVIMLVAGVAITLLA